jgi:hypothetical protein
MVGTLAQMIEKFFIGFFPAVLRAAFAAAASAHKLKANSCVHHRG